MLKISTTFSKILRIFHFDQFSRLLISKNWHQRALKFIQIKINLQCITKDFLLANLRFPTGFTNKWPTVPSWKIYCGSWKAFCKWKNPECVTDDAIDLVCLINKSKKPGKFNVPRKSNTPDKPKKPMQIFEDLNNRRPGSLNDEIAASYAYPYVFGSPYAFGYQPRVIHAPIWW